MLLRGQKNRITKRRPTRHIAALGLMAIALASCGGSGGGSSGGDVTDGAGTSISNGAAVDGILRGRGSDRFAFAPEFLNGVTGDTLETIWKCALVTGNAPLVLLFGFAENSDATALFSDGTTIGTWNRTGNTLRMEFDGNFKFRADFTNVTFTSDVNFGFLAYATTQIGQIDMDESFPADAKSILGSCRLADAASEKNLDSAPYATSEGPASYNRDEPVALARIPDIVNITEVATITGDPNNIYSFRSRVVLSDGTYTSNAAHLERHGIAVSRMLAPEHWGQWKTLASGEIGFRKDESADFVAPDTATVYSKPAEGLLLNDCFTKWNNSIIGGFDGIVRISSSNYCFADTGVFSHGKSVSTTAPNLVAASGSDTEGIYKIKGFAIELTYGNGAAVTRLFAGNEKGVVVSGSSFF